SLGDRSLAWLVTELTPFPGGIFRVGALARSWLVRSLSKELYGVAKGAVSRTRGIGRSSLSSKGRDEEACSRFHLRGCGLGQGVEGCGRVVQACRGQGGSRHSRQA